MFSPNRFGYQKEMVAPGPAVLKRYARLRPIEKDLCDRLFDVLNDAALNVEAGIDEDGEAVHA